MSEAAIKRRRDPPYELQVGWRYLRAARGGSDNVTALVLRAEADGTGDDDADRSRTTEVNLKLDTLKDIKL